MLNIEFKPREETIKKEGIIRGAEKHFNVAYSPEWLKDPLISEIIKDVDKSELEGLRVVSPILGDISVRDLSGGCKTLINIFNEPQYKYMSHELGDNCFKWLMKIADRKDVTLIYSSYFDIPEECEPFRVHIMNNDSYVTNMLEFWKVKLQLCDYM